MDTHSIRLIVFLAVDAEHLYLPLDRSSPQSNAKMSYLIGEETETMREWLA